MEIKRIQSRRLLSLGALLVLAGCGPSPDELLERASSSLKQGDARSATIDLKALLQEQPNNAAARAMLASALLASGDFSGAEIELEKAEKLGLPAAEVRITSCELLLAQAKHELALEKCDPESVPDTEKVQMQVARANALLHLGRPTEARELYLAALSRDAGNMDAFMGAASATQAEQGVEAAKAELAAASEEIKDTARYWLALGGLNMLASDFQSAASNYSTALAKSLQGPAGTESLLALGGLAEAQMQLGDLDAADRTTDKLISRAPGHPQVKQLRGQVLAARGKTSEARALLEDVVSKQPNNWNARTLLGIVQAQQGNYDQAQMHLQAVVANQPDNVRAQRVLAEIRARLESPGESLAGVKQALDETAQSPSMLAMAGRLSLAQGNKEQALTYLAAANKSAGAGDPQTQLDIANGYLAAGEIDRALEVLESMPAGGAGARERDALLLLTLLRKGDEAQLMSESKAILERSPKDASLRNVVGNVYAAAGKLDLAEAQFNEATKLAPKDPTPHLNLARLDLARGNNDAAEARFKRALEKDPRNLTATLGLAAIANVKKDTKSAEKHLLKARQDHPAAVEPVLALGKIYLTARQPAKARAVVDEAAKANPGSAAMANARGIVLIEIPDLAGAIASLEEAVRLAPGNPTYAATLARAKVANRDSKGALAVLDSSLRTNPGSAMLLAVGAATSLQAGQIEKAAGYVERMRQVAPDAPGTYALEGDLAMAQKRYKDAVVAYRRASARGTNTQLVLSEFNAASRAGEANPEASLVEWVRKNPGDAAAVTALAEHRRTQGRTADAVALYDAAIAKNPDNPLLLNNAAVLYGTKGDPKAEVYAARAYKAAPKVPSIADTYGWVLFRQGKTEQALPLLREAAKGLPDSAEVQYHLAAALAKSGDKAQASSLLNKALRGQLPADQKAEAQKLQQQLAK